jgi:hypothetical protein
MNTRLRVAPVMSRGDTVLLGVGGADCRVDDSLVASAKGEITNRRRELIDHGVTWGFLLGVERDTTRDAFPAAWTLCDRLQNDIAQAIDADRRIDFRFSFCKGYSGPAISEAEGVHYEGLHIDTHPDLADGTDLLRILINVDSCERRFRFGDVTRRELAAMNLYEGRDSFRADHVQQHVMLDEVAIPGRRGTLVSFLLFWASVIPHVGITEPPGYFLYSFEALVPSPRM